MIRIRHVLAHRIRRPSILAKNSIDLARGIGAHEQVAFLVPGETHRAETGHAAALGDVGVPEGIDGGDFACVGFCGVAVGELDEGEFVACESCYQFDRILSATVVY